MKWYKHMSKSLSDPVIFEAISRFGGDGYLVFFGILELMSDEFDVDNPGVMTFSWNFLRKNLQLSKKKILKICQFYDQKAEEITSKDKGFFINFDDNEITIDCKKLAILCDDHTQKLINGRDYKYDTGSKRWSEIKREIRARDKYICVLCGKTTEENKRSLSVHHIRHFKLFKDVDEANSPNNLISLCLGCHNIFRSDLEGKELRKKLIDGCKSIAESNTEAQDGIRPEEVRSKKEEVRSKNKDISSNEPKKTVLCNITFSFDDRKFEGIEKRDIKEWEEAYPAVDIGIEINRAKEWLLANPSKRKKNYRRFLINWFNRTQERGGTKHGASTDQRTYDPVEKSIRDAEQRLRGNRD